MQADHYDVLGVPKTAGPDEIKRAYRTLARQHHPDKNPGDRAAEEKFKRVGEAFAILSNPEKRRLYDELGHEAEKIGYDPKKAAAYRQWAQQAAGARGQGGKGSGAGFDLGDILGGLGGMGNPFGASGASAASGRRPRPAGPQRGEDIESVLDVSFEDAIRGATARLRLERPTTCAACAGSGDQEPATSSAPCSACGGSGVRHLSQGGLQIQVPCSTCGGGGLRPAEACPKCQGRGRTSETTRLEVKVPAGIEEGQKIRLSGQGAAGRRGGASGDLLLQVRLAPHPVFARSGRDLELELPVTVAEILLGAHVDVPTLDGQVRLKVPAGSQTGARLRIRGKGVPASRGRPAGDLLARLRVVSPDPDRDPEAAKNAAAALEGLYPEDVRRSLMST